MTMTRNKAQKTAARQRMAQTGEPYSVARRAVGTTDALAPWVPRRSGTAQQDSAEITPEERYAREAEAAGVPAAEIEARLAGFRAQEAADWAQRAAEQARELAERAEQDADRAEERADLAQEAAELAQGWADEPEQDQALERASRMQQAAEQARERAERAAEAADRAEEQADLAQEAADEAAERAGLARDTGDDEWGPEAEERGPAPDGRASFEEDWHPHRGPTAHPPAPPPFPPAPPPPPRPPAPPWAR